MIRKEIKTKQKKRREIWKRKQKKIREGQRREK
jgi:hypothetical protein